VRGRVTYKKKVIVNYKFINKRRAYTNIKKKEATLA
jgi:hypothetical protein